VDAVEYAHGRGVVHRDLKPENILVTPDGEPHVIDFGIAREPEGSGTRTGTGMGTVEYMAPEQYTDARAVDRRADIYSLGMILYEMLAGRLPWDAGTPQFEILEHKARRQLVTPAAYCPDIPAEVVAALSAALSADPASRLATAGEFAAILARANQPDVRRVVPLVTAHQGAPGAVDEPAVPPAKGMGGAKIAMISGLTVLGAALIVAATVWMVTQPARRDRKACGAAEAQDELEVWRAYLERYADGRCTEQAEEAVQRLEDRLACDVAVSRGTLAAWRSYLASKPHGVCAGRAESEVASLQDSLARDLARSADDREGWRDYLSRHPDGTCADQARRFEQRLVAMESWKGLFSFYECAAAHLCWSYSFWVEPKGDQLRVWAEVSGHQTWEQYSGEGTAAESTLEVRVRGKRLATLTCDRPGRRCTPSLDLGVMVSPIGKGPFTGGRASLPSRFRKDWMR